MCCENDDAVEWKRQVPSTLPLMPAQDHPPSLGTLLPEASQRCLGALLTRLAVWPLRSCGNLSS